MSRLLVPSRGIRKIPNGKAFLPEYGAWISQGSTDLGAVAGWGHKPTASRARQIARRTGVPYVALEDGFLRSIRLGRDGEPPLSLVVDPVGIYYDARQPSQLELWLEEGGWESNELLERAELVRRWLVDERLSKYNFAPDYPFWSNCERERVLVVDQTDGDLSVTGGLADRRSFARMLEAALDENPHADVVVRLHPEVVAGHRPGCLGKLPEHPRLQAVGVEIHPWAILDGVAKVYTVSSLLGMEALLAGLPVRCFGMPFYAGWGLTGDELTCPRRTRKRTLDEIFAVAYLKYARYVDPVAGERCEIEQIIALLSDRRRHWLKTSRPVFYSGASFWKRKFLPPFIASPPARARFVRRPEQAIRQAAARHGRWALWASRETERTRRMAEEAEVPMIRVEDGFIRSVGLGSDLVQPGSLILDDLGIYYAASRPSRLEVLLRETQFSPGLLSRARNLQHRILQLRLTKYNVGRETEIAPAEGGRPVILVPGQVEDDASILQGAFSVRSDHDLLQAVRRSVPEAYVIYKPHPDVVAGNRRGLLSPADVQPWCDLVVTDVSMDRLLKVVDQVHTITSLTGFEALLRGKQVTTYGLPFYAGWGLTEDRLPAPRRGRRLSLEQLVAGALILYPTYIHPKNKQPCSVEHLIAWLATHLDQRPLPPWRTRLIRFVQKQRSIHVR